jgi:lipopolysaccharide assembly outer membrane protein LptD (OstA)
MTWPSASRPANRQVEFTDAGGTVIFASYLELDSDMKAGVAVDLASRFANGSSLMAATAVRRSEHVNELNYAIFTPCPICDAEGRPKQPSISIQAEKVVQNEEPAGGSVSQRRLPPGRRACALPAVFRPSRPDG